VPTKIYWHHPDGVDDSAASNPDSIMSQGRL